MKSHPSYELVGAVGRGRLATVYRARDIALKREVAIKELNDTALADPQLLQRFWDEARFLANLEHDNVVQIYGLDQERGWVIMELADSALDTVVARGPLPAASVRGVLRQVLDGLDCLHQQGHIHGAIKPGNLLVTGQGLVKLSDITGVSGGSSSVSVPKYLAPEQLDPAFGPIGSSRL
jgi:serine/threonine protein kinase